jgi:hypothetical protein
MLTVTLITFWGVVGLAGLVLGWEGVKELRGEDVEDDVARDRKCSRERDPW